MKLKMSKLVLVAMVTVMAYGPLPLAYSQDQAPKPPSAGDLQAALEKVSSAVSLSPDKDPVAISPAPAVVVAAPEIDGEVITHWPLQNAPIRLVLRQLAMNSRRNIVASPKVTGEISADLFDVTVYEALEALLTVNGFDYVEQGDFIYVYTNEEMKAMRKEQRQLITRVFHLHYIKPKDASALIAPCLSADARMAATPDSEDGIGADKESAGGMDYAVNDVLIISDYEENLEQVEKMLENADRRPQQILIEATIMVAQLSEDNSLGINFSTNGGVTIGGDDIKMAFGPSSSVFATGEGLELQWVGNDMDMLISAIESITDVNILANPKLLVLNRQRGEIVVGRERGYPGKYTYNDDGVKTGQEIENMETGTRMVVRPFIGDNGYIRMEIHPEDSSGTIDSNLLPDKTTSECTSNILVQDGHTIIISGMFRESDTTTKSQIPILGSLPFIGAAFRSTQDQVEREEMIILITPRIIRQSDDQIVSDNLREEAERFRLSMRNNLQWFGRNRMAVRYFNWARELSAAGHNRLAALNLRLALHNDPAMNEALDLQERLTGKMLRDQEPRISSVKHVIENMIMNEMQREMLRNQDSRPGKKTVDAAPGKVSAVKDPDKINQLKIALAPLRTVPVVAKMIPSLDAADLPALADEVGPEVPPMASTQHLDSLDAVAPEVAAPDLATTGTAVGGQELVSATSDEILPVASPLLEAARAAAEQLARARELAASSTVENENPVTPEAEVMAVDSSAVETILEPVAHEPKPVELPDMEVTLNVPRENIATNRPVMDLPRDGYEVQEIAATPATPATPVDSAASAEAAAPAVSQQDQAQGKAEMNRSAYYVRPETGVRPLFALPQ